MQLYDRGQTRAQPGGSRSLGAAIGMVTILFVAAVAVFLTRDVPRFDLLRGFAPASQADYAFSLEQKVAPLRSVTQRGD